MDSLYKITINKLIFNLNKSKKLINNILTSQTGGTHYGNILKSIYNKYGILNLTIDVVDNLGYVISAEDAWNQFEIDINNYEAEQRDNGDNIDHESIKKMRHEVIDTFEGGIKVDEEKLEIFKDYSNNKKFELKNKSAVAHRAKNNIEFVLHKQNMLDLNEQNNNIKKLSDKMIKFIEKLGRNSEALLNDLKNVDDNNEKIYEINKSLNYLTSKLETPQNGGFKFINVKDYFNYKLFKLMVKYDKYKSLTTLIGGRVLPINVDTEVGANRNIPSNVKINLPSGNWVVKEEKSNVYYIKGTEKYDIKLGENRSYKVPDDDKYLKFNLNDKIYEIVKLKLPDNCIIIYDFKQNDFISVLVNLNILIYGVPLVEYNSNDNLIFYSPNKKLFYSLNLINKSINSFKNSNFELKVSIDRLLNDKQNMNIEELEILNKKVLNLEKELKEKIKKIALELDELNNSIDKNKFNNIEPLLKKIENDVKII
tara:strand:- start:1318 stop:2760 length:1443 start_codon:yes stop_codon:yes gene_type:complete